MVIVVMGVSGCGKTSVGSALAARLGWRFFDADDFHSPANIARMRAGVPLTEADREPWLESLRTLAQRADAAGENIVLACSALRRSFRESLREGLDDVRFVHLQAERDLIARRLAARIDHFMNPDLLDSQFDALERPEGELVLDASEAPETLVEQIRGAFAI